MSKIEIIQWLESLDSDDLEGAEVLIAKNGQAKKASVPLADKPSLSSGFQDLTYETTGDPFDTITYENNTFRWIKIGRLCFIKGRMRTDTLVKGSASGNVRIGNLPFPVSTGGGDLSDSGGGIILSESRVFTNRPDAGSAFANTTQIILRKDLDTSLTVADMAEGNGNILRFSLLFVTQ